MAPPKEELLSLAFNQDNGCFAVSTSRGFRIHNADPFEETHRRTFEGANAGVACVQMLFRCNILALVGGGKRPKYPPNKVMIWDDHQGRCIGELSFRVDVRGVRLRRDKIVVVLERKVYVYNFSDLAVTKQVDTCSNLHGACALSPGEGACVMACPGLNRGQVRVELFDRGVTKFIPAHEGEIRNLQLSRDGATLATASDKGTLVRVFDTATGAPLRELRRGADRAAIHSIAFAPKGDYLAVASDKGTAHVYALMSRESANGDGAGTGGDDSTDGDVNRRDGMRTDATSASASSSSPPLSPSASHSSKNAKSPLSFVKGFLPKYFSSSWSLAQYKVGEGVVAAVAFGREPRTLIVVTDAGEWHKVGFDPVNGGACARLGFCRFMKTEDEEEEDAGWDRGG